MNANYATKVSLAMPFVTALVGMVAAASAHADLLAGIISGIGGFVLGFCTGALSIGLSGLFLTNPSQGGSSLVLCVALAGYFVVPLILLAASCWVTVFGLRWVL